MLRTLQNLFVSWLATRKNYGQSTTASRRLRAFLQLESLEDRAVPAGITIGSLGSDFIVTGDGNDLIIGRGGDDTLNGGGGRDHIISGFGNDSLIGGEGNDILSASFGDDTVEGGSGRDFLLGSFGDDELDGGSGDDYLSGSFGDDLLVGGEGRDTLLGGFDDDTLDGGAGVDKLDGSFGNDTFLITTVDDGERLNGGFDDNVDATQASDIDTGDTLDLSKLDLEQVTEVFVDLDERNQGALNGNPPASQNGILRVTQNGTELVIELRDLENIIGSDANETLFGNNESNVILGGDGDDRIHPFGGVDFIDGGAGTDILLLNAANNGVTIDLAAGVAGPNTFVNIEDASGSANFGDQIFGDDNANLILGNGGDDILDGRGGVDTLEGGTGNDVFLVTSVDDGEIIDGGEDVDTLDISAVVLAEGESLFVDLDINNQGNFTPGAPETQDGVLRVLDANGNILREVTLRDIENIIGSENSETLFGNNEDNVILGGGGDDRIHPFGGTDFVDGGEGTDTLLLNAATGPVNINLAEGVAGTNSFVNLENAQGGAFDDTITGDDGHNVLVGNDGVDVIDGGEGDDTLNGSSKSDTLTGGSGADAFLFDGDPFDGADVSGSDRSIIGGEDFITDFSLEEDRFQLDASDFGVVGPLSFVNATADDLPTGGVNVIVLQNSENPAGGDFLAGTAANLIAEKIEEPGPGFFVYFNSRLKVNRLVYSTDLSDPTADLKIVARDTKLEGQDAIDALLEFEAANFEFVE